MYTKSNHSCSSLCIPVHCRRVSSIPLGSFQFINLNHASPDPQNKCKTGYKTRFQMIQLSDGDAGGFVTQGGPIARQVINANPTKLIAVVLYLSPPCIYIYYSTYIYSPFSIYNATRCAYTSVVERRELFKCPRPVRISCS